MENYPLAESLTMYYFLNFHKQRMYFSTKPQDSEHDLSHRVSWYSILWGIHHSRSVHCEAYLFSLDNVIQFITEQTPWYLWIYYNIMEKQDTCHNKPSVSRVSIVIPSVYVCIEKVHQLFSNLLLMCFRLCSVLRVLIGQNCQVNKSTMFSIFITK